MGAKFVASYSGGKDSALALHRAIRQGLEPVALITTYNTDRKRSWFHGIPEALLEEVSLSLGIPIWLIKTSGDEYEANFEKTLKNAKNLGANYCVFGDIDIEAHRDWGRARCANAGIEALFPLWGEKRESLVYELIDAGFTANITIVDTTRLSDEFLGLKLTRETAKKIDAQGADICGENGEYHTFVSDGPIFRQPVKFFLGEKITEGSYAALPLICR